MKYDKSFVLGLLFSHFVLNLGFILGQLIRDNQIFSNYTHGEKCILCDFAEIKKMREYALGMNRN